MLRIRSSSASNARSHRRRSVAISPATALLLLHGVSGSTADTTTVNTDTYRLFTAHKEIKFVANPPINPLGECEGDCDNNDECADGLICHQRDGNEDVPGCPGGGNDSSITDYCIRPAADAATSTISSSPTPIPTTTEPMTLPTVEPTPLPTAEPTPLPTVEPTALNLTTAEPTSMGKTTSPTTPIQVASNIQSPTPSILTTTAQPTAKPTQLQINRVGNNGEPQRFYPLGLCQGDCDNDDECAGDLICHQREPFEPVPGCDGGKGESGKTDYCILPPVITASPTVSSSPTPLPTISSAPTMSLAPSHQPSLHPTQSPTMGASAPVRLRLYWQSNYRWQETSKETFWCLQCRHSECKTNSIIEVDHCSSSKRQKFQYYEYDKTFRPMTDPDLCFEENGWDFETNPIQLKRCNGSSRQRWTGFKETKGIPFEFISGRNSGYCMTQAHHPKPHERVFPQQCGRARRHTTSKWVVY